MARLAEAGVGQYSQIIRNMVELKGTLQKARTCRAYLQMPGSALVPAVIFEFADGKNASSPTHANERVNSPWLPVSYGPEPTDTLPVAARHTGHSARAKCGAYPLPHAAELASSHTALSARTTIECLRLHRPLNSKSHIGGASCPWWGEQALGWASCPWRGIMPTRGLIAHDAGDAFGLRNASHEFAELLPILDLQDKGDTRSSLLAGCGGLQMADIDLLG